MAHSLPKIAQDARHFTDLGLPVFPISIRWFRDKWEKIPLTKHGHKDALPDVTAFDWSKANGFGIAMGNGWYALDIDDHKEGARQASANWIDEHKAERNTRQHKTPSGGWHLIYRLPEGWENLRTRANVTTGLDTRGNGGWIAFGEGYKVIRDVEPALLSIAACKRLDSGADSADGGPVVLKGYKPPENATDLQRKLKRALIFGPNLLKLRWRGDATGMVDKSGSALDHSVAKLLSIAGFNEDEIMWVLLNEYEHGSAASKGQEHVAVRAAGRSAVKMVESSKIEREEIFGFQEPETSAEIEEMMLEFMKR